MPAVQETIERVRRIDVDQYKYGFVTDIESDKAPKGLSEDIVRFMQAEFTMTGSDGSDGHPRKYGTFPRTYRLYVKERHVLSLPEFVHRSSQMAAETFGLKDRGVLAKGAFADVIVFDDATYADRATYEAPELLAAGVRFTLVNGQLAIDRGEVTKALAGRALRRERD